MVWVFEASFEYLGYFHQLNFNNWNTFKSTTIKFCDQVEPEILGRPPYFRNYDELIFRLFE
jgi:hypothetical protein